MELSPPRIAPFVNTQIHPPVPPFRSQEVSHLTANTANARKGQSSRLVHSLILLHILLRILSHLLLSPASRRRARQRRMKLTSSSFQERRRKGRAPFCVLFCTCGARKDLVSMSITLNTTKRRHRKKRNETPRSKQHSLVHVI